MNTAPTQDSPAVASFYGARWNMRWLVVGLVFLLSWHSVSFVDREWLARVPSWLVLIITGFVPQAFLLIFPILARDPNHRPTIGMPARPRCLIEFALAIPLVIVMVLALTAAKYIVGYVSPGTSLAPNDFTNMARSPNQVLVYFVLLFSFTFAPVAEEVFFRGFLYNAFRARMPFLVAALVQSLIFGFSHFFGVLHAGTTFAIGLLLTAIYQWRKTLITPIFVHAGFNSLVALGMVFAMDAYANSAVIGVVGDPNDNQCVIRQIAANSPAENAGLQVGDVITSVNAEPIRDFSHLLRTVPLYKPGDAIRVTIIRSGSEREVTVVLGRRGDS